MTKTIIGLTLLLVLIFSLTACSQGLAAYKENAKQQIETYANAKGQINYTIDKWALINASVESGKISIDAAENYTEVDKAVNATKIAIDKYAKKEINKVSEEEKIMPMDGAENYTAGCGTEEAPYIISNRGQLIYFSNQINEGENTSAHFALASDIDLDGMEWTPIGIFEHYKNEVFNGVFDGNGYEISNFRITDRRKNSRAKNIGLFGCTEGTIKNLGVTGVDIDIFWYYELGFDLSIYAGCIAGSNIGVITNCYAIGNINLDYYKATSITTNPYQVEAGGLVGDGSGNLENCYAVVDVSANYNNDAGSAYAAGLTVGNSIKNCYAIGGASSNNNSYLLSAAVSFGEGDLSNCYIYEGQVIGALWPKIFSCTTEELNDPAFYTDKLGWSADDWDLKNLNFVNGKYIDGKYPRLKKN